MGAVKGIQSVISALGIRIPEFYSMIYRHSIEGERGSGGK